MRKLAVTTIIGVTLMCLLAYMANQAFIYNSVNGIQRSKTSFKRTDEAYKLSFIPSRSPSGAMNVYVPEYKITELEYAQYYASLFGMSDCQIVEDDDMYLLSSEGEELKIFLNIGLLEYTSAKRVKTEVLLDDDSAVNAAIEYLSLRSIYLGSEEVKVLHDANGYSITFVDRLGNLKNYAFPQRVELDECGNIKKIIYYFIDYKKIGTSKIKSMEDAYLELPEFADGTVVDLQKGQLVYFYENSVVQAGYLFEGEIEQGKVFECYVKASVY